MKVTFNNALSNTVSVPEGLLVTDSWLQMVMLHFGARMLRLYLAHTPDTDTLAMPPDAAAALGILPELDYDIRLQGNNLFVGPVIGIVAARRNADLTPRRRRVFRNYVCDYSHLKGMVMLFALDGIDLAGEQVNGYFYHPGEHDWIPSVLPLPGAVYKRCPLPAQYKVYLWKHLGDRVFNSYLFDKWELFQYLNRIPAARPYLPATVPFDTLSLKDWYWPVFRGAIIKPVNGRMGLRVLYLAAQDTTACRLTGRLDGKPCDMQFNTLAEATAFLESRLKTSGFLLQQPVDLLQWQGRVVDFRVIIQKDGWGTWRCQGSVARLGATGNIVSNISAGGEALTLPSLGARLGYNAGKTFNLQQQLNYVAFQVGHWLDACGIHGGDYGVDLGVDRTGQVWLLEVNNRDPDHSIALDIADWQLYYRIKSTPLQYARFLAMGGEWWPRR